MCVGVVLLHHHVVLVVLSECVVLIHVVDWLYVWVVQVSNFVHVFLRMVYIFTSSSGPHSKRTTCTQCRCRSITLCPSTCWYVAKYFHMHMHLYMCICTGDTPTFVEMSDAKGRPLRHMELDDGSAGGQIPRWKKILSSVSRGKSTYAYRDACRDTFAYTYT